MADVIDEHTITIDGAPVFYRAQSASRTLYLHDVPTSSEDWCPFLERLGGIAPDLIGFGRSGKGGHLDYSPEGMAAFAQRFLEEIGADRVRVVGHGWGAAIGLLLAAREPARVDRLVLIDAVPLLNGFRWPSLVRLLRLPVIGELMMGSTTRSTLARVLRRGVSRPDAWSEERLSSIWDHFDQGTQRAILRLHRSASETRLAELGMELGQIAAPTMIVWGTADRWLEPELSNRYAARLPKARIEYVAGAGHWPWFDDPETIELVARFLRA
jgi:pimeloyl-ACP methyl ester carboxylesterase